MTTTLAVGLLTVRNPVQEGAACFQHHNNASIAACAAATIVTSAATHDLLKICCTSCYYAYVLDKLSKGADYFWQEGAPAQFVLLASVDDLHVCFCRRSSEYWPLQCSSQAMQ